MADDTDSDGVTWIDSGHSGEGDAAALAAVDSFWKEDGREEAAAKEVPDSRPSRNAALEREYKDQQDEITESGGNDPNNPDGSLSEEKLAEKQANTKQKLAVASKADAAGETGLDPILRSIAEEAGWTQAKIDRFYAADPELATETFEGMADSYAKLSRQYLEQIPAANANAAATAKSTPAQSPAVIPSTSLPAEITDEGLKRFAETEGDAAANTLKAIRDHFAAKESALSQRVERFEQSQKESESRAVAAEATPVLAELRGKFPKLYGKGDNPQTWTVSEYNKNVEVATMADQIRSGALAQGRPLSVSDAIRRAHYIVSRDSVKTEAREEIAGKVRQRAKNATAKPSHRGNPAAPGNSKGDEAAVAAAAEVMAQIGFND